jgi:hypothetical protein
MLSLSLVMGGQSHANTQVGMSWVLGNFGQGPIPHEPHPKLRVSDVTERAKLRVVGGVSSNYESTS